MKYIILVIAIIFGIQSSSIAQRGYKGKVEHLKSELGLSDTQAEELKSVLEDLRKDKDSAEDQDKRTAMKEAIQSVLTDEQLVKFEEISKNGRRGKGHMGKAAKRADKMKKGLGKDEETLERLKEMRVELEESISNDDKALIDELRVSLGVLKGMSKMDKADYKELSDEEKKALRVARKEKHEEVKAEKEKLKVLVEKYKLEIESLFEENETFFKEKKEEQKEQWKEIREEKKLERKEGNKKDIDRSDNTKEDQMSGRKNGRRGNAKRGKHHLPKHAGFLLMDPNMEGENAEEIIQELNSISVSPNPASSMTNVTYDVKQGGQVRVEIRDETGRIYEVITNEVLEAGTYTKAIETSKYQDKTYYVSISDGKTIKTEKLLIQK